MAGTIISSPVVSPLVTVSPGLHNYQISPADLESRVGRWSDLVVQTLALTALLPPLVLPAGLAPLSGLLGTGALAGGVLLDCDGGTLLVTPPSLHPALAQHHRDGPGSGQPRHTPRQAGAGGAASATLVNLNISSGETSKEELASY